MKRIFMLLGILFSIQTVFSQNIVKAEYFIDADPGQGNGITVPNLIAGETVNFPITIPTTQLSSGFHFLNIRVADVNGIWSRYETRVFYLSTSATTSTTNIVGAEYFIDSDPGVGGATQVNIGSSGAIVNFPVSVSIPMQLSAGFHFLAVRVKDQEGKWSLFEQRGFYVAPNPVDASPIVAAEYFYDTDPGMGSASPLIVTPSGDIITQTFLVPVPGSLSQGDHVLAIRVRDQQGHWSFLAKDTITVGNSATISCPGNITVTAQAGQCTAIVNGLDPTTAPPGSSYTYTLTGATIGTGTGTASGKTFNAGTTTVTYALTNSPSTSCSFTVTVNSNITPSISIQASTTNICYGQPVTFTTSPVNGGVSPAYQWRVNGSNIPGAVNSTYQNSSLQNDDVVSVIMTSSLSCASPSNVPSNNISIAVTPSVAPVVNIQVSATTICSGTNVTFTATPINGGVNPVYQWKLNGNNIGSNSPIYQTSSLQNGDKVKVVMTSSALCASPSSAASEEVTMIVNTSATPSVTINATATAICAGQPVTFTATPINGGNNPVYEWLLNSSAVGSNSPTYQSTTLKDGDIIRVTMVPSQNCGSNIPVVSNTITMIVGADVTPSLTMSAVNSTGCSGTLAIFYASPLSGAGSSPSFQWKRNGVNIPGATNSTYQSSSLQNGDVIRAAMTSSLGCANPQTVLSHDSVTMVISSVPLTPSVTISASSTAICQGQTVLFTALPTNGGDVPGYQWKVNGINIGDNIDTFSTNSLQHGDKVTVEMFTSVPCSTSPTATAAPVTMTVTTITTFYADFDGDGYGNGASGVTEACSAPAGYVSNNSDCNDDNAFIHPGRTEICGNGIDDDCDGLVDESCGSPDNDSDGYTVAQGDCNDNNASIHPGASEVCGNNIDDDCDGQIDEACGSPDNDSDGYTVAQGDCNDNNASIHPGASEVCGNNIDDDCDGQIDEACGSPDNDSDGYTIAQGDCNDNNSSIHPEAQEICSNSIDDNCNGQIDENCTQGLPTLMTRVYPVKEGDAGFTTLNVVVTLDNPAQQPVSVKYRTINEDAIGGTDYESTSGTLTIPAGKSSASLQVKIIGDLLRESNERFRINFSDPVNVVLPADPNDRIMIIDDDKGKPNSASPNKDAMTETIPFKIPTVVKRNTVWMIPQIGNYENEVLILNVQGQIVSKLINYKNQTPVGNVATGLYFYRIRITEGSGQNRYYSGRLLITE